MKRDPDLRVETLQAPSVYAKTQIERAFKIAAMLAMISPDDRGKLVLLEPPARRNP